MNPLQSSGKVFSLPAGKCLDKGYLRPRQGTRLLGGCNRQISLPFALEDYIVARCRTPTKQPVSWSMDRKPGPLSTSARYGSRRVCRGGDANRNEQFKLKPFEDHGNVPSCHGNTLCVVGCLKPTDVDIQVEACGICGSDVHTISGMNEAECFADKTFSLTM